MNRNEEYAPLARDMNRRDFMQLGAAGLGAAVLGTPEGASAEAPSFPTGKDDRTVGLAILGVGLRGRSHLDLALRRDDTEVIAINDIDPEAIATAQAMIREAGQGEAAVYAEGEYAFEDAVAHDDVDGVVIATPWRWHVPMALAAMKQGAYVGVEVPAALTLDDCWELVRTSQSTGTPCMMLENVCYRRDVMAILHMVRQGLFGELVHLEGGYQHDLRAVKFNDGMQPHGGGVEFGEDAVSEARWRTQHSVKRNGDLYPTHGVGPVATMANINRGNRFLTLTSTASKTRGLHRYVVEHGGRDHPNADVRFHLGDVVTTVIQTANGETIEITHDTNLPRPYSLGFRVQGTAGIWMDVNDGIYLEGTSPEHQWEAAGSYLETHDHPLWRRYEQNATGAGHGGMDFFVLHAFIESIKRGVSTPLDVYDAAAWSAISPLSEASIAQGSAPQSFPDFTGGRWVHREPVFALDGEY